MSKRSLFDKAVQLAEQAKIEKDNAVRRLLLDTAAKYYRADILQAMQRKPGLFWHWTICIFFYLLVSIIFYMTGRELGLWAALAAMAAAYAFLVLVVGSILCMLGHIQGRDFISLVREGFKSINMFWKT